MLDIVLLIFLAIIKILKVIHIPNYKKKSNSYPHPLDVHQQVKERDKKRKNINISIILYTCTIYIRFFWSNTIYILIHIYNGNTKFFELL